MPKLLEMRDFLTLEVKATENKRLFDECNDAKSDTGKSLLTHVKATHAALVNGNRRFYRPDRMQDGAPTWISGSYPKPVLVGHDKKGDCLGRVKTAKYIDESWKYVQKNPEIKNTIFYQTDSRKKMNLYQSVDYVVNKLHGVDTYEGLGYIELGLNITNPEAIRKVLADEYLTVSAGFKTDSAICSICHTDWAQDGQCEHELGDEIDGKDVFLITGELKYDEISFVNIPADPFATKISAELLTDTLNKLFFLGLSLPKQRKLIAGGLVMSDSIFTSDITFADEDTMTNEDVITPIQEEMKQAVDTVAEVADCGCDDNEWKDYQYTSDDERLYFEDEEGLYEEMSAELETDAKLSSKARKDLKGGTFCGPNRSFPVPDCAHVTAARRLIGRASVSDDTKSRILSCVSRKAKSLSCGGSKGSGDALKDVLSMDDAKLGFKGKFDEKMVPGGCMEHYDHLHAHFVDGTPEHQYHMLDFHNALGGYWESHNIAMHRGNKLNSSENTLLNANHQASYTKVNDFAEGIVKNLTDAQVEVTDVTRELANLIGRMKELIVPETAGLSTIVDSLVDLIKTNVTVETVAKLVAEDQVIVPKSKVTEYEDTITTQKAELERSETDIAAANGKAETFFRDSKKSLATQFVVIKALSSAEGYTNLTRESMDRKIEELTRRNIISLRDAVKDAVVERGWSDLADVVVLQSKPNEHMPVVAEDTRIVTEVVTDTVDINKTVELTDEARSKVMQKYFSQSARLLIEAQRKANANKNK